MRLLILDLYAMMALLVRGTLSLESLENAIFIVSDDLSSLQEAYNDGRLTDTYARGNLGLEFEGEIPSDQLEAYAVELSRVCQIVANGIHAYEKADAAGRAFVHDDRGSYHMLNVIIEQEGMQQLPGLQEIRVGFESEYPKIAELAKRQFTVIY